MECQDVRQLLAFVDRKNDELDAAERAAMQQHLEKCPDCADLAQAERCFDASLGAVLRDVPVPADLKQKVMQRLAVGRGGAPWKGLLGGLAAALLMAMIGAGVVWNLRQKPQITLADVQSIADQGDWDAPDVKRHLAEKGVVVEIPSGFNYRNLQHVDVVEFKGRRVPKLVFARPDGRAVACVLVLTPEQFRLQELQHGLAVPGTTSIQIQHDQGVVNVIFFRGELSLLLLRPTQ